MPTLKEQVAEVIRKSPGLTDREITDRVKGPREPQQAVNQVCRKMAAHGLVARRKRDDGLTGNYLTGVTAVTDGRIQNTHRKEKRTAPPQDGLSEDAIKEILKTWLTGQGWHVEIAWGRARGIDIQASKGNMHWIIEVKGSGSLQAMRVNYFLAILGELLQRMGDPNARYSIALPDMAQFRGLWQRLPELAKKRTGITALFVGTDGQVSAAD